jgi:predicted phosphodiesterase
MLVIGVNTTRPARHTDGEISSAQVKRVAQRLRGASRQQLRIVVTHQPVLVIRDSDLGNLLHGHEAAVREWASAGADIIMGGHIHLPYVRALAERFSNLPRRLWAVQAGTAVSSRVRSSAPNSVNVVRRESLESDVCSVEKWDFSSEQEKFVHAETHRLELDRSPVQ